MDTYAWKLERNYDSCAESRSGRETMIVSGERTRGAAVTKPLEEIVAQRR